MFCFLFYANFNFNGQFRHIFMVKSAILDWRNQRKTLVCNLKQCHELKNIICFDLHMTSHGLKEGRLEFTIFQLPWLWSCGEIAIPFYASAKPHLRKSLRNVNNKRRTQEKNYSRQSYNFNIWLLMNFVRKIRIVHWETKQNVFIVKYSDFSEH